MGSSWDGYYEDLERKSQERFKKEAERLGIPVDAVIGISHLLVELFQMENKISYADYKRLLPYMEQLEKYRIAL